MRIHAVLYILAKMSSLPVLSGKFCVVWDPALAQSAFCNSHLSPLPTVFEFAIKQLKLSKEASDTIKTTNMLDGFPQGTTRILELKIPA
jgi:hypothetical protein